MDVKKVAKLANLTVSPKGEKKLVSQFEETLKTVEVIKELNTEGVEPISQVTGLTNVMREDEIDEQRIIKIGDYFKVKAIFNNE
jgi:aspartyl-tRNA(Asn)/glutamyl-tRNA(Gln) amidotransferase subunit C